MNKSESCEMNFNASAALTMGVELEVQILNSRDFNLARDAEDLLLMIEKMPHPGAIKPEITESMIELNSTIHGNYDAMVGELREMRDVVSRAAERLNLRIAGGGSHPFHIWSERRIFPSERFRQILNTYGYLAKQFTIFGQHVHVGCADGDTAIYLIHMLSRYVPHFIALSASSPFQQGEDTAYQSSRLNTVSAFPLSGHVPFVQTWDEFTSYYTRMKQYGVIESMKDFYWDIRPKPDYGTVEIRVFDTPLTVERAALIAAYVQSIASYILAERPLAPLYEVYLLYSYNRFQACRYGLAGELINAYTQRRVSLREDVMETLRLIGPHAAELGNSAALEQLAVDIEAGRSDAVWLREAYKRQLTLNDVARMQSDLWMGRNKSD